MSQESNVSVINNLTVPTSALRNQGFTKLGALSPNIKVATVTGNLSMSNGGSVDILLDSSIQGTKIILITGSVEFIGPGSGFPPNFPSNIFAGYGWTFYWYGQPVAISVYNVVSNAANIYGRKVTFTIFYTD